MRLYVNNEQQWSGTQADAKVMSSDFIQVEVPVDKSGLIDFLNSRKFVPKGMSSESPIPVTKAVVKSEAMTLESVVQSSGQIDLSLLSTALFQLLSRTWSEMEAVELEKEK